MKKPPLPGTLTLRRIASLAAWAVAAGALGAGWVYGVPRLQAYAQARQPGRMVQVILGGQPARVDAELRSTLVQAAASRIGADPFRRDELVAARQALLDTGWLQDVAQVTRLDAHRVLIEAHFAAPVAVVRDAEGRQHVVDDEGRLLPRSYPAGTSPRLPAITGAAQGPPEKPGQRWPGDEVGAGLALLRLVGSRPWSAQVDHVDVAGYARQGVLRIITDRGATIVWGRRPGEEGAAEVPAAQKLGYLDYHFRNYGRIDRGLQEVDVTGDVVVGR